jgi:hypothetical protein
MARARWCLLVAFGAACLAACADTPEPETAWAMRGPRRPPPKPGDSITKTIMCSCKSCEPSDCCRDLEKEAPPIDKECAKGYDFTGCQTPVQSCESRCFQQRWRVRIDVGCDAERPRGCCHASAEN